MQEYFLSGKNINAAQPKVESAMLQPMMVKICEEEKKA